MILPLSLVEISYVEDGGNYYPVLGASGAWRGLIYALARISPQD